MADTKLSALTAFTTPQATDELYANDGGVSKKITYANLEAAIASTANVTAAGALMDSEVTNLAAVKAFDPTDYATAAQGATADAALPADGSGEMTGDLVFAEAADHSSTPAAGKGYVWVKNTAPSTLIFTNDAGTDTTLGSGGGASQLSDLSDVNTSTATNRNVLVADGVDWESRALTEADISDLGSYLPLSGGTLSGNIAFSGAQTVDGRDVSADGSKLDGIESSADVTDETNVVSSLSGATLTAVTVATGDKVLVQDADDTDNLKTVTAQSLADLAKPTESIVIACSDETTALTTGTGKVTFRMPYAFTLTAVRASVTTAPVGSTIIVDINEGGTSIMTANKLSIDAGEKTSTTAATAAGITDSSLADDAEITIDIDQIGSSTAGAGLKVALIGKRT